MSDYRVEIAVHVEANQLPEDNAGERALRELLERDEQRVGDLADHGRAAADRFVDRCVDGRHHDRIARRLLHPFPALLDNLPRPSGERRGRRHLIAKVRQLEMRVRVDQAWHDSHVTQFDAGRRVVRGAPSERDDAAVVYGEPAVADWLVLDRNEPGGVVANHRIAEWQDAEWQDWKSVNQSL